MFIKIIFADITKSEGGIRIVDKAEIIRLAVEASKEYDQIRSNVLKISNHVTIDGSGTHGYC